MATRKPRYSKEEFARRGNELYESKIRALVDPLHQGRLVAIDIETGAYEVDDLIATAAERLFERNPNAQPWIIRIGHPAVFRIGGRSLKTSTSHGNLGLADSLVI
jgi:hypothetical protein